MEDRRQILFISPSGGMDTDTDPYQVSRSDATWQENVWADQDGRLVTRPGLEKIDLE